VEGYDIYNHISERTKGDIYIGVVGPVRTGKSTFIKNFMDLLVIPNLSDKYQKERANDELPQSASGKTIMTTEPKFVPNEAARINLDNNVEMKVRLVDCVGYMVDGALGYMEESIPRMVNTPWFEYQIPFEEAAELGTKKVINDHSTIGLVITTDGSITGIDRKDYVVAEERVINELKDIKKPFIIILNSSNPNSGNTMALKEEMEAKYKMPVTIVDCLRMHTSDINRIFENLLFEFPLKEVSFSLPEWINQLKMEHWLKTDIINCIKEMFKSTENIRQLNNNMNNFTQYDFIKRAYVEKTQLGVGSVNIELMLNENLFYNVLSEAAGFDIEGEHQLLNIISELMEVKNKYTKVESALKEVNEKGYGVVTPRIEEMSLEEPEIIRQGNKFGVRLRASAPSIHMIRADIETEIAPLVGNEKQSEELVNYLLKEFEDEPDKIWQSNMFGKSLHELVSEGLQNKLYKMPEDAQLKLQETLQRIINEGSGGLICIIL